MKIEITEPSVFDREGKELAIGTVVTIKGDEVPGYLAGKGRVLSGATAGKVAVTNPAEGATETAPAEGA